MRQLAARVARNAAWLASGEVVLKAGLFAAGVVVARGLGPEGMGAFTIGYGAAMVLMGILAVGQVEVLIRETARLPEHGKALFTLSRSHQRRLMVLVLPLAAGGALLAPPGLRWTLVAFIPYAFLRRWLITMGAVFKGLDRMDVEVLGRILEIAVVLPCLVALSLAGGPTWGTGAAFCVGGAGAVTWLTRRMRLLPDGAAPLSRAVLAREGLPFLGLSLLHQLILRVDTFLLASLGVAQAAIGRYGVATAPVQGLAVAAQVIAVAVYPSLARAAAAGTLRVAVLLGLEAAAAAFGGVLSVLVFAFREPIVRLFFGPEFAQSAQLLGILIWGLPAACASMLAGVVIAAMRRQRWPLATQSVVLAGSVAANLLAIPRWGVAGCAAVTVGVLVVTAVFQTVLAVLAVRRGAPATLDEAALAIVEGSD